MSSRAAVETPELGVVLRKWAFEAYVPGLTAAVIDAFAVLVDADLNPLAGIAPQWSRQPWSGPYGVVAIDVLDDAAGNPTRMLVEFGASGLRAVSGGEPKVIVAAHARDLADLVAGRTDGALLYLADRLAVAGDGAFLLELGAAVAPTGWSPFDPAALDPEAVSAAIDGVSTDHLDAVMAGPFRDLVLGEVFRRLPEFLRDDKAARVRLDAAFEVGGRADGLVDRYLVAIDKGTCLVSADPAGEGQSDTTLVLTGAQFLRLVLGHLNPVRGVLSGEVQVRGELMKALALNSVMRIPGS